MRIVQYVIYKKKNIPSAGNFTFGVNSSETKKVDWKEGNILTFRFPLKTYEKKRKIRSKSKSWGR